MEMMGGMGQYRAMAAARGRWLAWLLDQRLEQPSSINAVTRPGSGLSDRLMHQPCRGKSNIWRHVLSPHRLSLLRVAGLDLGETNGF
jgi:hypothetical protein